MNALEATDRLAKLKRRANALARVIYYMQDEREWADDVDELSELHRYAEDEYNKLADKLRDIQV